MRSKDLDALLTADDVAERYRLGDRRAARRIIDEAGGFKVAGRLLVRLADLEAYEDRLRAKRAGVTTPAPSARTASAPRRKTTRKQPELEAEWWRGSSSAVRPQE